MIISSYENSYSLHSTDLSALQQHMHCFRERSNTGVKSPTKANTALHDGGVILTNETSTSDPL